MIISILCVALCCVALCCVALHLIRVLVGELRCSLVGQSLIQPVRYLVTDKVRKGKVVSIQPMTTYKGTKGNAAFILNLDTRPVSGELRALADLT